MSVLQYKFKGISFSRKGALDGKTPFNLIVEKYFGEPPPLIEPKEERFCVECCPVSSLSSPDNGQHCGQHVSRSNNSTLQDPTIINRLEIQRSASTEKYSDHEVDLIGENNQTLFIDDLHLQMLNDSNFLDNCTQFLASELSHVLGSSVRYDQTISEIANVFNSIHDSNSLSGYEFDDSLPLPVDVMKFILSNEKDHNRELQPESLAIEAYSRNLLDQQSIARDESSYQNAGDNGGNGHDLVPVAINHNPTTASSLSIHQQLYCQSEINSHLSSPDDSHHPETHQPNPSDELMANANCDVISPVESIPNTSVPMKFALSDIQSQGPVDTEKRDNEDDSDMDIDIFKDIDRVTTSEDESTDEDVERTVRVSKPVKHKAKKSPYPSALEVQNAMVLDLHLQLEPRVHIVRLPSFMLDLKDPASELDQIYTTFTNNLFKEGHGHVDYIYRHTPKSKKVEDQNSDNDDTLPTLLVSKFRSPEARKRLQIADDSDEDKFEKEPSPVIKKKRARMSSGAKLRKRVLPFESESSSDMEESDECVDDIMLNSDDDDEEILLNESEEKEYNALPEEEKREFLHTRKPKFARKNRRKQDLITLSSDEEETVGVDDTAHVEGAQEDDLNISSQGSARKNIKRVLTEAELEKATKEATSKERKRMERLAEQEKQYNKILPAIEKERQEPCLILDIDIKSKKARVEVSSLLVKELKPHQLEGVKFLYNSTIENVEKLEEEGSGCILAHCMGLGKSLQVITFVHTLLSNPITKTHIKTILIVVPVNTLKNWSEEFDKWITKKGLKCFNVYEMVDEPDIMRKAQLVESWSNAGGILIIGIPGLAALLNLQDPKKKTVSSLLVQVVEKHLCDPGPDMLIIDEGHLLKDHKTRICKSVDRIKTKRKIVLTGTPLQNNLDEYRTMISIIKPRLLGSKKEFANRFRNPIENGQKADSNANDVRLMKQRSTILNKLLSGCIQRFGYETLKPYLKPKLEYTIFIRPSQRVAKMYNFYLDHQKQRDRLLWDSTTLRLCVNHPALYQIQADNVVAKQEAASKQSKNKKLPLPDTLRPIGNFSKSREFSSANPTSSNANELDQQSTSKATANQVPLPEVESCAEGIAPETGENPEPGEPRLQKDWFKQFSQHDDWKNIELSGKFIMLFKILKACIAIGDKLLVVSQSLETLDLIEKCLQLQKDFVINNEKITVSWDRGRNYYRIDGQNSVHERLYQIKQFNDPKNADARLFLLSTKAGGIGINLIGANRCIIFDVSWNPSDDIQAIFRVYRLGQTKPVYVYRFVTKDTMEEKIFRKQIVKLGMSIRVIDRHQVKRAFKAAELSEFYQTRPKEEGYEISLPDVPQDRLLADLLHVNNNEALECTEFDSLLEKKPDEELTEEERQAAWAEYQKERDFEIQAAEERKKELEAEQRKDEELMYKALRAEEDRMNLKNERKRAEEMVAAEKITASVPTLPSTPGQGISIHHTFGYQYFFTNSNSNCNNNPANLRQHLNEPPRISNQGTYNYPDQDPNTPRSTSFSPSSHHFQQHYPPPQAYQDISPSPSSALVGVPPNVGLSRSYSPSHQNDISNYNNPQPSQPYNSGHRPVPTTPRQSSIPYHHNSSPYHHNSSPYLANRPFGDTPPEFRCPNTQRPAYTNSSSIRSQPESSHSSNRVINNSSYKTLPSESSPLITSQVSNQPIPDKNPPTTPASDQATINQSESSSVVVEETSGDSSDKILSQFSDLNLSTCSLTEIILVLLNSGIPDCPDKIIEEIEKIRSVMINEINRLDVKSYTQSLTNSDKIRKTEFENILENLQKQIDLVTG